MALVRIIDVLVQYVKILGGRQQVPVIVRIAAWLGAIVLAVAGIGAAVTGLVLLYQYLETLPPTQ
ncbi:hypothetical protein [Tsukamurella paurometabola]|nr:hypothetical protein [Tsukamurella paurometabola]UEA81487.1 hypothetical protein LK411_13845 [Tsukamurella paurometabola]VDR38486.1 Uncharacterised protein [Tsukamurella paurometabola]